MASLPFSNSHGRESSSAVASFGLTSDFVISCQAWLRVTLGPTGCESPRPAFWAGLTTQEEAGTAPFRCFRRLLALRVHFPAIPLYFLYRWTWLKLGFGLCLQILRVYL